MEQVTKYRAADGREYARPEQAATADFLHALERELRRVGAPPPDTYANSSPQRPWQPRLPDVARYRRAVRHLFLEEPAPQPEVRWQTRTEVRHLPPRAAVLAGWLMAGVVLGFLLAGLLLNP